MPLRIRTGIAVAAALLLWTLQDILVWQRIFEGRGLWQFIDRYQYWHQAFLVLLLTLGVAWLGRTWGLWFAAATWTLANSGLADVLYYWLDGKPIPLDLPWLNDNLHPFILFKPTGAAELVLSSVAWIGFWTLTLVVTRNIGSDAVPTPQETPALAPQAPDVG